MFEFNLGTIRKRYVNVTLITEELFTREENTAANLLFQFVCRSNGDSAGYKTSTNW